MSNVAWLAKHLAAQGELTASAQLLEQLDRVGVSTLERILSWLRQDGPRLPRRDLKSTSSLLRDAPMKRIPWQEKDAGHFETDLVQWPQRQWRVCANHSNNRRATACSERVPVLGRKSPIWTAVASSSPHALLLVWSGAWYPALLQSTLPQ
jgi:hypothetical protein